MVIQDLINAIDMSKLSSRYVNFDQFADEVGLPYYGIEWKDGAWDLFEERVKAVPIYTWLCTDTFVGIVSYFLDTELACLSFQTGRKTDKNFYWVSNEAAKSVWDFIDSLRNEDSRPSISLLSDFHERNWDWEEIKKAIATTNKE